MWTPPNSVATASRDVPSYFEPSFIKATRGSVDRVANHESTRTHTEGDRQGLQLGIHKHHFSQSIRMTRGTAAMSLRVSISQSSTGYGEDAQFRPSLRPCIPKRSPSRPRAKESASSPGGPNNKLVSSLTRLDVPASSWHGRLVPLGGVGKNDKLRCTLFVRLSNTGRAGDEF